MPSIVHKPGLASLADLCPLLVVLGAGLVNSGMCLGTLTEADAFRERVFKSFKDVFLSAQPEATRDRLSRVISFLSFVSPTRKNDALLNQCRRDIGCSQLDIDDDLERSKQQGYWLRTGKGFGFTRTFLPMRFFWTPVWAARTPVTVAQDCARQVEDR